MLSSDFFRNVVLILSSTLLCFGTVMAHAATYYVSTTGNDSNSGTEGQPLRTIVKGMSVIKAGDTLYIRGGKYAERIDSNVLKIPIGNSWSDAPVISGYPGERVTLSPGSSEIINLPHAYIQYMKFENLVLDGQSTSNETISVGSSGAHHIQFKNVEVKNAGHHGVTFHYPGHHLSFLGGSVHHIGNPSLYPRPANKNYGFYVETSDCVIDGSEIYNTNDYGIHNYTGFISTDNNIYRRLRIHHTALLDQSMAGILLSKGTNIRVYNNLLYSNVGHGIQIMASASRAQVYNNTVYGGSQTGIQIQPSVVEATVVNNISYGNAIKQISDSGTGTILRKNITTDPRFMNPTAFDFGLQSSSPAIDAGDDLNEVTTDIRLVARPQGSSYDVGAYEGSGAGGVGGSSSGGGSSSIDPPRNIRVH